MLGKTRLQLFFRIERQVRLAGCCTMERQRQSNRRSYPHCAVCGFDRFQGNHTIASRNGNVRALPAFPCQIRQNRPRLPDESHVMDVASSEQQAFDAKAIVLGRLVLFYVSASFQRRQQTEDVVLVELEPLRKFGYSEFVYVAKELFQHVQRMCDGLDDVIGFVTPDHRIPSVVATDETKSAAPALEKCFNLDGASRTCQRYLEHIAALV